MTADSLPEGAGPPAAPPASPTKVEAEDLDAALAAWDAAMPRTYRGLLDAEVINDA